MRGPSRLRLRALHRVRRLRRFLRRFWRPPHGRVKVFVGRHQVVPHGDAGGVSQPACHHLHRIDFDQFRFPARPQVVEQSRPRLQAGATDDLAKRGPQVGIHPARRAPSLLCGTFHRPRIPLRRVPGRRLRTGSVSSSAKSVISSPVRDSRFQIAPKRSRYSQNCRFPVPRPHCGNCGSAFRGSRLRRPPDSLRRWAMGAGRDQLPGVLVPGHVGLVNWSS